MKELEDVLRSVPDCYDDFVVAMKVYLKDDPENMKKIIEYIKNDSEKRTDDVLEYLDELWGI